MKFRCTCGNLIDGNPLPNPLGFRIIDDESLEKLIVDSPATESASIDENQFWQKSSRAFQCDKCRRLWIARKANEQMWDEYIATDSKGHPQYLPESSSK